MPKKTKTNQIDSHYIHIDNGGITITVNKIPKHDKDDKCTNFEVVFSSEYFGYPSFETRLNSAWNLTPQHLKDIGEMFIRASTKLSEE